MNNNLALGDGTDYLTPESSTGTKIVCVDTTGSFTFYELNALLKNE